MSKNLVIVESPAKAKTIGGYLGKDFTVKSSMGHIRDLPRKGLNIDIKHDFTPTYEISPDKQKIVSELKKAAKGSEVWLASDEDREGEAIAWHLTKALGLDPKKTKRIVFHEITKPAIERAVESPRNVDEYLVNAYQARRVLDRLVGYEISPILWKKVRAGLSAGRVQSVAVRLIVEREREIKDFKPEGSFKVTAIFDAKGKELPAELSEKLKDSKKARQFMEAAKTSTFTVKSTDQKPGTRSPGAPFTTSTLQQEASRRLGFSVRQTMTLAQRLYEAGSITYMRTDSTIISGLAIKAAEDYIVKNYGQNYHERRQYKTKKESAQEAHEAIRPTDFAKTSAGTDSQQQKLYQLIWQRALAGQMAAAQVEKTEVTISVSGRPEVFVAKGEVLKFDGFMKVYGGMKDDVILPPLKVGDKPGLKQMLASETFSRPPTRYSEAALVRKLEELGIGRPSTYAPTISTIQTRGYVTKGDLEGEEREISELKLENSQVSSLKSQIPVGADRGKLLPTAAAEVTTDFLIKYFPNIVDYDFTANVENDFDKIAEGAEQWQRMIAAFYKEFHPLIAKSETASREEVSQARQLGVDPKTGKPIMARFGRYGPMLQRGEAESEEKPDFAPLPDNVSMEDVTLEQALEMFKLPRLVGKTTDGQEIRANIGRYGPFIQVGKLFVSIKGYDPMRIKETEARKLYLAKMKLDAKRNIAEFKDGLKVLNGPYGPYVTDGRKNARIDKSIDAKRLTEEEARKILEAAPFKRRRPPRRQVKA